MDLPVEKEAIELVWTDYIRLVEGQHLERLLELGVEKAEPRDVATLWLQQGIDDLGKGEREREREREERERGGEGRERGGGA